MKVFSFYSNMVYDKPGNRLIIGVIIIFPEKYLLYIEMVSFGERKYEFADTL